MPFVFIGHSRSCVTSRPRCSLVSPSVDMVAARPLHGTELWPSRGLGCAFVSATRGPVFLSAAHDTQKSKQWRRPESRDQGAGYQIGVDQPAKFKAVLYNPGTTVLMTIPSW